MTQQFEDQVDAPRFTLSEQDLFKRLVKLETDRLTAAQDIKAVKGDAKFHKDNNPKGIPALEIKRIAASAVRHANRDFEEKSAEAKAVFAKYAQLTGYNDKESLNQ